MVEEDPTKYAMSDLSVCNNTNIIGEKKLKKNKLAKYGKFTLEIEIEIITISMRRDPLLNIELKLN